MGSGKIEPLPTVAAGIFHQQCCSHSLYHVIYCVSCCKWWNAALISDWQQPERWDSRHICRNQIWIMYLNYYFCTSDFIMHTERDKLDLGLVVSLSTCQSSDSLANPPRRILPLAQCQLRLSPVTLQRTNSRVINWKRHMKKISRERTSANKRFVYGFVLQITLCKYILWCCMYFIKVEMQDV